MKKQQRAKHTQKNGPLIRWNGVGYDFDWIRNEFTTQSDTHAWNRGGVKKVIPLAPSRMKAIHQNFNRS